MKAIQPVIQKTSNILPPSWESSTLLWKSPGGMKQQSVTAKRSSSIPSHSNSLPIMLTFLCPPCLSLLCFAPFSQPATHLSLTSFHYLFQINKISKSLFRWSLFSYPSPVYITLAHWQSMVVVPIPWSQSVAIATHGHLRSKWNWWVDVWYERYCSRRRNVRTCEKYLGCEMRRLLDYCCSYFFLPLHPSFILPRPPCSVPCSSGYAPAALSCCSKSLITLTRSRM